MVGSKGGAVFPAAGCALNMRSITSFLERVRDVMPSEATGHSTPSIDAVGRRWRELGLRPGDVVLICLPNGVALLEQFFGVLAAGAVPALVAPTTPKSRLRELSQAIRARAVVGVRLGPTGIDAERWERMGTLAVALFDNSGPPAANAGEVVILTSGTSGFSSGCVFEFDDLLLNAERHADAIGQRADDVVLVNLPLHFSFALVAQALATLVRGGRLILGGPPFHAATYINDVQRYAVTVSSLTPVLVRPLVQLERPQLAALRVLTVGGDSLAPPDVERLLAWRPGGELYLTYGLTEAGPRVATLSAHCEPAHRYASVGKPLAGTNVWLRDIGDGTGRQQLFVSSATIMRRRIGLVERGSRDESLPPRTTGPGAIAPGTIATGDVFEQDQDGYLFFQGRLSDYLVRGGEKICLTAVRRLASQLPDVVCARTRVVTRADGEPDYELTLHASGAAHDYQRLLRRTLRLAEMPGAIKVEVVDQARSLSYK